MTAVSWQATTDPECIVESTGGPIDTVIVPRRRDVGGFDVMRALPSAERRAVGPFVFFDQFGPLQLIQGKSLEVRPHPHIGLATVTYLFAGKIMHRDNLGTVQPIQPGEVNWMTAGRGIVHSERTSDAGNPAGAELFGIQTWVALPKSREETPPAFAHHAQAELPVMEGEGIWSRIILGTWFGRSSPVVTFADPVYIDCLLSAGARVLLPTEIEERAVSIVSGEVQIGNQRFVPGTLAVFTPKAEVVLTTNVATHFVLIGGPKLDGPRIVWWNFVSSSQERIEAAKADWRAGRLAPVPGDDEFIPLPERPKHRSTFWYLDSVKFPEDQTATEEVKRNRPAWLNSSLTHEPQAHAVLRSVGLVARLSRIPRLIVRLGLRLAFDSPLTAKSRLKPILVKPSRNRNFPSAVDVNGWSRTNEPSKALFLFGGWIRAIS